MRISSTALSVLTLAAAIGGCEGGSTGAPTPAATAAPTPAPATGGTPAPTPSAPAIAGVTPQGFLQTSLACIDGIGVFDGPNLGRHLIDIATIDHVRVANGEAGNSFSIQYRATDVYYVALGWDDAWIVGASGKQPSPSGVFDYFTSNEYAFELYRNGGTPQLNGSTFGSNLNLFENTYTQCFFTAGKLTLPNGAGLPTAATPYTGFVDGVGLIGGRAVRLFGSTARATLDPPAGLVRFEFDLVTHNNPTGAFLTAGPTVLGRGTATIDLRTGTNYLGLGNLTGPGDFAGTVTGVVFDNGVAIGAAFELADGRGGRIVGIAAIDRSS